MLSKWSTLIKTSLSLLGSGTHRGHCTSRNRTEIRATHAVLWKMAHMKRKIIYLHVWNTASWKTHLLARTWSSVVFCFFFNLCLFFIHSLIFHTHLILSSQVHLHIKTILKKETQITFIVLWVCTFFYIFMACMLSFYWYKNPKSSQILHSEPLS